MKNKKKILICLVAAILLVAGGIFFYYWYEGSNYISTKDARIAANTVIVTPQISGKITAWNVTEGDQVKAGDSLGAQDTNSMASSSSLSATALNQVGSVAVGKAEITAPISGEVIKSSVEEGQLVSPGQTLAVIADTSDLYVSANIEETKVDKVKPGQIVDISIDALPGRKFTGRVEEIGKATLSTFAVLPTQSSNGNFTKVTQLVPVKIRLPESSKLAIVPGMSVEIKIHIKQ